MEDRQPLIDWMDALEFYARDWDETFGSRSAYFTQEFWYMLVGCVRAHWAGNPLTVSQLAHTMKSGSNRTREERIKKAVDDGYLEKAKDAKDGRATVVIPTPELESLVTAHLQRTLEQVMSKFPKTGA